MARLTLDLELDGEIQTLAQSVDAMDIGFGPSGGVIGWLKLDEHRLYWAPLDDRGELFQEPHMYPVVPQTPRLGLARCADRILYAWPDGFRTVRVDGLEIETGDLLFQRTHPVVERECDLIAGADGALLLSRAEALLVDTEGLGTELPMALPGYGYENPNGPVGLWAGDHYLVGWSDLSVKVGAQEQASASYCYVYNAAGSVTISRDGTYGPERFVNAVWQPRLIQPWFVGAELHLQLGDVHTNKLYHARVDHDGSVELLESVGGSSPCDTWMLVRPGVVAEGRLVTYRNEHYTSRWGDVEHDDSYLSVLGGASTGLADSEPRLGRSWSVAVVEDAAWVVSDLQPHDEPRRSLVYGPDRSPILLEPTPTHQRSRILEMSDRPYVLWQVADTLFGGFVPGIAEDGIEPTALHTAPGLLLDAAVNGGRGGLVLFRSDEPTSGQRLSALILRASGDAFGPPTMIAGTSRLSDSHAAWDGERFIAAWQEPSTTENAYDVKITRVAPNGSALDEGGQTIATTDSNGQPLVAAAAPHLIAVSYGASRVRTVEDVTPIAASGPFAVSFPRGIEITWTVGAGDVRGVTVERAPAAKSDSAIFATVFEDHSGGAASYLDTSLESGHSYRYLVRLREGSGEELVLGLR